MTPADLGRELMRLTLLLDNGLAELRKQSVALADAEHDYRAGKARAWAESPAGTVPEREAWVNGATAGLRHARDLAEVTRQAALEAVRSRRTQISALQSWMAAERAEAEFARTGPEVHR
jgi:hypothetical protein